MLSPETTSIVEGIEKILAYPFIAIQFISIKTQYVNLF